VHDELGPRPVHRHRLDRFAVARELAILDDAALLEFRDGLHVTRAVERHGELELVGADSEIRACERDALGVAGELKFRRRRPQRLEPDVAVGENEHAAAGHAPVHASGHLQDLVRAEVHAREHVAPAIDHVREPRVVDDHRVQSLHVERALTRGGHREEIRLLHRPLEERTDHADRLAAVVELRRDRAEPRADRRSRLLDSRARRQEHADAALFLRHLRQELVVEESQRIGSKHFDLRGLGRIKDAALDHAPRVEISRVERRIDRRRKPDEAAADALAECETELELGARLVDLVDDERVLRTDVSVLEPAARDARGDDHDVPRRRLRRRLAFAIDHADAQFVRSEKRQRDRADRQRLSGSRSGNDSEAAADRPASRRCRRLFLTERRGERGQLRAVRTPERCLDVETESEFDCFAGRARGRDDDQAARRTRTHERIVVGREVRVANAAEVFCRVDTAKSTDGAFGRYPWSGAGQAPSSSRFEPRSRRCGADRSVRSARSGRSAAAQPDERARRSACRSAAADPPLCWASRWCARLSAPCRSSGRAARLPCSGRRRRCARCSAGS
jgi:hypothetical protein